MKLNHKYNVKSYINCLLQTENGEPLPEDKWPSEDYWKEWYPKLFPDSSSELEDEQEQVGHRLKVKTAIVLPATSDTMCYFHWLCYVFSVFLSHIL